MDKSLKIVTWNIQGGIRESVPAPVSINNKKSFEGLLLPGSYFSGAINQMGPDIICFQEIHTYKGISSYIEDIGRSSNLTYNITFPLSDSHHLNHEDIKLGISILSKYPITSGKRILLNNPQLTKTLSDKLVWKTHDKGLLIATIKHPIYGEIRVISLHLLPFHRFEVSSTDPIFISSWHEIDELLCKESNVKTIIGGDFNQNNIDKLLPLFFNQPDKFTDTRFRKRTHNNTFYDHIIYSNKFEFCENFVFTRLKYSDHYPCYLKLK